MAKIFGKKSAYGQIMKKVYYFCAFISLFLIPYSLCSLVLSIRGDHAKPEYIISLVIGLILAMPLLIASFLQYKDFLHQSRCFSSGLWGEDNTEQELERLLDKEYSVFQDIIVVQKKGNIDFVVVGPTGVFTLEVKNHKGKIDFDGNQLTRDGKSFEKDFLKQAMAEALTLHDLISDKLALNVFVKPVIVFANSNDLHFGLIPKRNVFVISKNWLDKLFKSQPVSLSFSDQNRIEAVLQSILSRD